MKFFVGLGNPGNKYKNSRHNTGYMMLDYLAASCINQQQKNGEFIEKLFIDKKKLKAKVFKHNDLVLIKPQTFMNGSGESVRSVLDFYSISISNDKKYQNLIVFHDDLDLGLGQYKIQFAKGPHTHNGLESIYKHLGSKNFYHVRVGVDSREGKRNIPVDKYVLMQLDDEKLRILREVFAQILQTVENKFLIHNN